MEAKTPQRFVEQYLKELRGATGGLSRAERRELQAQIEEHIRAALPAEPSEAEVRAVLERLGSPEEIVAEQLRRAASPPGGRGAANRRGGAVVGRRRLRWHRLDRRSGAAVELAGVDDAREDRRHAARPRGARDSVVPGARRRRGGVRWAGHLLLQRRQACRESLHRLDDDARPRARNRAVGVPVDRPDRRRDLPAIRARPRLA